MDRPSAKLFLPFSLLWLLWLLMASGSAFAQTSRAVIYYNHAAPQAQFAANEIRAAFAATGVQLVERELREATTPSSETIIIIAAGVNEAQPLATKLGIKPLRATTEQAYAIRVKK